MDSQKGAAKAQILEGPPIERQRLYEHVASRIEAAILAGDLQAGDSLPSERSIMKAFGVGRTAVREALFALEKSGFVKISNGQRAIVTRPTAESLIEGLSGPARHVLSEPDRLRQMQQARMRLEGFLARVAALEATPEQLEAIEQALIANKAALDDAEAFVETNLAFHFAIAAVVQNIFIEGLQRATYSWLKEQRNTSARDPGALLAAYTWHEKIFQAIKEGNPDKAEAAMLGHLDQAQTAYWRVVEGERVQ